MGRKSVVITGASTGIGKSMAKAISGAGFRVFAGVRKPQDGESLRAECPGLEPVIIDVVDPKSIELAVTEVSSKLLASGDTLFGLINNAGVVVASPLEYVPMAKLREQFEVNTFGPVAVTQGFLPLLDYKGARIIFVSSVSGLSPSPFVAPYSASKFALESLADGLRMELKPRGIEVILIEPGMIATPIWEKSVNSNEKLMEGLPASAYEKYGEAFNSLKTYSLKIGRKATPPEKVALVALKCLTKTRPKTRYLVGIDARINWLLYRILPDRLFDWVILSGLKVLKKSSK